MRIFFLYIVTTLILVSCAQTHLDKGNDAFEKLAYKKASRHFEKYLAKKSDPIVEAKTAATYEQLKDYKNAESHYASALKEDKPELDPEIKFRYAQILLTNGKKEEALKWAKAYLQAVPNDKSAKAWVENQKKENLPDENAPVVTLSLMKLDGFSAAFAAIDLGGKVYFTGEKEVKAGEKANPMTGKSFFDVYMISKENSGQGKNAKALVGADTKFHDGPLCFSSDNEKVYVTRSASKEGKTLEKDFKSVNQLKIYELQRGYPDWTLSDNSLKFNAEDASTMHPALSPDGTKLFFSSDRPGGQGGFDLYYVEKEGSSWSAPTNLGFAVNSSKNEVFPFLAAGDTLYLASDKVGGMGGLDIYMSVCVNGKWMALTPLQAPFNTAFDDFSFFKQAQKEEGYISSNRDGKDQIYTWSIAPPVLDTVVEEPVADTIVEVLPTPKPVFKVVGKVVDLKTRKGLADVEVQLLDADENVLQKKKVNTDGTFAFDLAENRDYQLHGVRKNSFTRNKAVSTQNLTESKTFEVELELETVELATTITLKNIYYDYGKADIRLDAAEELKNLVRFMKDNPKVSIQVNSHTDSQGKDVDNLVLSDNRAQSVKDYLQKQGIPAERVLSKGFGETKLVNDCSNGAKCSDEQHQENRRTEFTVLKLE